MEIEICGFFFEKLYQQLCGIEAKTNSLFCVCVLQDYKPLFAELFDDKEVSEEIIAFIQSKQYIIDNIQEYSKEIFLYQQPIILLLYYLTDHLGASKVRQIWSFPAWQKELNYVFVDLDKQP